MDPIFVPLEDQLAACDIIFKEDDSRFPNKNYCRNLRLLCEERTKNGTCQEPVYVPSSAEVEDLATGLHLLYGTHNEGELCHPELWGNLFDCRLSDCEEDSS